MIIYDGVISSNIRALAFKDGVGYVEFMNGRRFAYKMPLALFQQMKDAKSIGTFYSRNVRKKFEVVSNGWCCDNSPCKRDATLITGPAQAHPFRVCMECAENKRFVGIDFLPIPTETPA